ncbi:MAG: DUF4287 domain-containing protein [Candidatus Kapaibacterium sp.]
MDQAEQTMIDNLAKNTGKSLEEWIGIVKGEGFEKHGEIIKYLKGEHGFTHGFANMVAHKSRASDAGSVENSDDLIEAQYKGREQFRPLYNQLISYISTLGFDVEIAPKKTYVSLRRKKQFATVGPATKSRFEIGVNLKGEGVSGVLKEITAANAMCSHKINLTTIEDVTPEVLEWLKLAYERAG